MQPSGCHINLLLCKPAVYSSPDTLPHQLTMSSCQGGKKTQPSIFCIISCAFCFPERLLTVVRVFHPALFLWRSVGQAQDRCTVELSPSDVPREILIQLVSDLSSETPTAKTHLGMLRKKQQLRHQVPGEFSCLQKVSQFHYQILS